jgi:hypothetical protein
LARFGAYVLKRRPELLTLRADYEHAVSGLSADYARLLEAGRSEEEIGRHLYTRRQELRYEFRKQLPAAMRLYLSIRDMRRYGNTLGPPIGWLVEIKSWSEIAESAMHPGGKDLGL